MNLLNIILIEILAFIGICIGIYGIKNYNKKNLKFIFTILSSLIISISNILFINMIFKFNYMYNILLIILQTIGISYSLFRLINQRKQANMNY